MDWRALSTGAVVSGSGHNVEQVCTLNQRHPEYAANARLIAAAPCMMKALEEAVALYGKPGGPWNVPSDPGGWLERSRAALSKAKGGRHG